jgi:hypothetical protein
MPQACGKAIDRDEHDVTIFVRRVSRSGEKTGENEGQDAHAASRNISVRMPSDFSRT